MAKLFTFVCLFLAFALPAFPQRLPEVDLSVNGIRSGTSYSVILKKLGKPSRIKNKGVDDCTSNLMKSIYYPGLVINLENYKKGRAFGVVEMIVTAGRWKFNYGLGIGADRKTVRARFGRPLDHTSSPGTTLSYVTLGNKGLVHFAFRNNRLVKVWMSETLC